MGSPLFFELVGHKMRLTQQKKIKNHTSSTVWARSWSPFEWPIVLVGSWKKCQSGSSPSAHKPHNYKMPCNPINLQEVPINVVRDQYLRPHLASDQHWKSSCVLPLPLKRAVEQFRTLWRQKNNFAMNPPEGRRLILTFNRFRIHFSTFAENFKQCIHCQINI